MRFLDNRRCALSIFFFYSNFIAEDISRHPHNLFELSVEKVRRNGYWIRGAKMGGRGKKIYPCDPRRGERKRAQIVPTHGFSPVKYKYNNRRAFCGSVKKMPPKNIARLRVNGVEFNNLMKADQSMFIYKYNEITNNIINFKLAARCNCPVYLAWCGALLMQT